MDAGSSYLPSELNAAYLYAQLEKEREIFGDRMRTWETYYKELSNLADIGRIELPAVPAGCEHNAHMFYIKVKDLEERTRLIRHMKEHDILAAFHYVPLHSAPAGRKYGRFHGEDVYTTRESERLVRLPLYYNMAEDDRETVISGIFNFYGENRP